MLVLGLDRDDRSRPCNGDVRGSLSLHDRRRCRGTGVAPPAKSSSGAGLSSGASGAAVAAAAVVAVPFPGGGGVTRKEGGGAGGAGGGGGAGGRTRVEDGSGVNATVLPTSGESGRT